MIVNFFGWVPEGMGECNNFLVGVGGCGWACMGARFITALKERKTR